jgi:NADH:ubiquinone oxidoreductase subunit F (NADH-binding)/(2Fe-2S) ferredoxin
MNVDEFRNWRDREAKQLSLRFADGDRSPSVDTTHLQHRREVLVCMGGACISCGATRIMESFRDRISAMDLDVDVRLVQVGCVGCCDLGVVVQIQPDEVLYRRVKEKDVERIVTSHLLEGVLVEDLLHRDEESGQTYKSAAEMPFFKHQVKVVLENSGIIDPERIEEYVACHGYEALAKALTEKRPEEIVEEIKASGLRGRGGGGFSAGIKWSMLAAAPGPTKHVICNADEGDPGAFMDRSVLESDPHRVLEGLLIAGYATGASHGVIYVRAEYPLAIKRLQLAIDQARACGLLGEDVFGRGFRFDIEIRVGAGAFVCGEETSLIASVEGKRGHPMPRPPYPTEKGLYGQPTMINNVETLANIAPIVRQGGDWYRQFGTEKSPGTKVFALAGAINNTGLVELPMGTTLRQVVFEIGGGIPNGRGFKAAQTGGPSGGCIPAEHLDVALDFDSLQALGSIMGSGGLIVLDDTACMVDVARFFMEFCVEESCGKCPPCRIGTVQMLHMLKKICEGEAGADEVRRLESLSDVVSSASLCGLGVTAPNPVLSTIRHFRDEYDAHIHNKTCSAGVCAKLLTFSIEEERCTGCSLCARNCPVEVIYKYDDRKQYWIDSEACIHCGQCFDVCRFEAVHKE